MTDADHDLDEPAAGDDTPLLVDPWAPGPGADAWVRYWRPFALPGNPHHGTWESAPCRVVAVGRDGTVVHEVANTGAAPDDAAVAGSHLRYTPAARVHPTREAAQAAAADTPNPNLT